MAHKLKRILATVLNRPQLITADYADFVVNALDSHNSQMAIEGGRQRDRDELQFNDDTKVGIIPIHGALSYIEYYGMCGEVGTSYQGIQSRFEALLEHGAKTIILDVDSPGGMAYSMMELGRYLRAEADKAGIKLIAYVDGLAASAGYGLAASAHEVIANPMAELGSIGVVVKLRNVSKAMKSMGIEDTYVFSGKEKIPFTPDGEFSKEFLEDIQEKVDALYAEFTSYVADLRGISVDAVKATEAKTFLAAKAVELGLADKTMTRESFFEYLADVVQNGDTMLKRNLFGKKEDIKMSAEQLAKLEELEGTVTNLSAELTGKTGELTAALAALDEKNAALEAATAALAEANAKLQAIADAEAAALKAAEDQKLAARKASLVEAVGEAEADTLFESLSALPDAAFEAVVGKMKASTEAREQTDPNFQELGHAGEKTAVPDSALAKALADKYGQKA